MKTNTKLLGVGIALLGVAGFIGTTATTFAYQGNPSIHGPNYTVERHTAMEKAFDTNNYTAWKELMVGKGRVTDVVTASNFSKFAQVHQLNQAGKTTEANALRAELGLGNGAGVGAHQGRGMRIHQVNQ